MNQFKIIPITQEYATQIRNTKIDEFGNKVVEQLATGYGPCRVSLTSFVPGKDSRLLLSHNPFKIMNHYTQQGPIFIHKKQVKPYADVHRFPIDIKKDKQNFPLSLIGYSKNQQMIFTKLVGNADVDELIISIFQKYRNIDYLHARNAEAGCFICKIERF